MSDSEEQPNCISRVPLRSPSQPQYGLTVTSADEILLRRQKFWSAHEALLVPEDQKTEVEPAQVPPKVTRLPREQPSIVIQSRHPGPLHPCTTQRDLSFDSVLFVLSRCRTDAALGDRFMLTDRSRFLSVLQSGLPIERWCEAERLALAGHLLLLCALANDEAVAKACARQLRSERCRMRDVLLVALSWGAAVEDLQLPQDFQLGYVTPAQPPPWCLVHTLRVLPSLLCKTASAGGNLPESASPDSSVSDVVLAARALALCALDARRVEAAEFIPAFAAVLASVQPWTEETVVLLADALHFPTAHEHAQAWVLTHLVQDQPLRRLLARRLLLSLLTPSVKTIGQQQEDHADVNQPMEGLEVVGLPFAGLEAIDPTTADFKPIVPPVTNHGTVSPVGQPLSDPSNLQVADDPMASVDADRGQIVCSGSSGSEGNKQLNLGTDPRTSIPTERWVAGQPEAMDVVECPSSPASTVSVEQELDSPSTDLLDSGTQLSGLVRLLSGRHLQMCALETYRRFIFVLVLAAYVGTNPISSLNDAADLRQLMAWLPKILMTVPTTTSQLDTVLIQSLIATTSSLWQGALERHAEDGSFSLSQAGRSLLNISQPLSP